MVFKDEIQKTFSIFILNLVVMFAAAPINGQTGWMLNFDHDYGSQRLFVDTMSNPNSSWQIGLPEKQTFSSAWSAPRAIMTDTSHSVSPNDTSSFYIVHFAITPRRFMHLHWSFGIN